MCQQTNEMCSQIELLCQEGMPRKIGKSMETVLVKRRNCLKCGTDSANSSGVEDNVDAKCTCDNRKLTRKPKGKDDILAISTQWLRHYVSWFTVRIGSIQKSNAYKILSKTTQPAHVMAVGILTLVIMLTWPNILGHKPDSTTSKKSGLSLVIYLGAFATHFGSQIWMTFVSGLTLYFSLPRHTFGLCQQVLFPKYYSINSMLSICTLVFYIKVVAGEWEVTSLVQVFALSLCAAIEVAVRLYGAPPLLYLMREKYKFETNVGSGDEVGYLEQKDLIKCPHYQRIHKAFRRIHMTVAMGNMTTLVCTFSHLYYLSSKITMN